jgi:hypothetical protein
MALWLQREIIGLTDQKFYCLGRVRVSHVSDPTAFLFILNLHFVIENLKSKTWIAPDLWEHARRFSALDAYPYYLRSKGRVKGTAFCRLRTHDRHIFMTAAGLALKLMTSKSALPGINLDQGLDRLPAHIEKYLLP